MINTVSIQADSEPRALAKAFRKALMTGGAVLELDPALSKEELLKLQERFLPEIKDDLADQVTNLIAQHPSISGLAPAVTENNASTLRRVFLQSLNDPNGSEQRLELSQRKTLPEDLQFLLSRDSSAPIRFYARSIPRVNDGN